MEVKRGGDSEKETFSLKNVGPKRCRDGHSFKMIQQSLSTQNGYESGSGSRGLLRVP